MGGEAEGFAQAAAGSAVKGWPGRRAEAGRGYRSGSRPFAFRAGLAPVRFHDLRHGAASQCKAAGLDTKVISAPLGHSRTDFMAPAIGLEPITCRLTAGRSAD